VPSRPPAPRLGNVDNPRRVTTLRQRYEPTRAGTGFVGWRGSVLSPSLPRAAEAGVEHSAVPPAVSAEAAAILGWLKPFVLLCLCLAILSGCGSSGDATLERDIQRGLAQIQSVHDRKALQAKLTALVAKLRHDDAGSQSARRARALAIRGFEAKLTSVKAEREFYENDSGQVAEATVDAARADKYRKRADELLRAAQQAIRLD
jgi:hypothetical protein